MKNLIALIAFLLSCSMMPCFAGIFDHIASSVPARDSACVVLQLDMPVGITGFRMGDWGPVFGACIGAGIAYKRQVWTGRNYNTFSFIVAPLLFPFTDSENDLFPWKIGVGMFISAFDGWCIGVGIKSGKIDGSKWNRGMIFLGHDIDKWKNK